MYAMKCTCLVVTYALSMVIRCKEYPRLIHWTTVKNTFKYLRNTKDILLMYDGEPELVVKGYSDASFQTGIDNPKS